MQCPYSIVLYLSTTRNITSASYFLQNRKQVISLLPTLSEKQGETYVFSLNSNTEVMVTNNIPLYILGNQYISN